MRINASYNTFSESIGSIATNEKGDQQLIIICKTEGQRALVKLLKVSL